MVRQGVGEDADEANDDDAATPPPTGSNRSPHPLPPPLPQPHYIDVFLLTETVNIMTVQAIH